MNPNYQQSKQEIEVELKIATEWDEFWSYVGSKSNQRWTWYFFILLFHSWRIDFIFMSYLSTPKF